MNLKKACLTWLVVYLLLGGALGVMVYRRIPVGPPAIAAAVFGGFAAWLGIAYIVGIRQKIAEAMMIARARSGSAPSTGGKMAAIGRIEPSGSPLVSPITGTACVAYKYEVRSRGNKNDYLIYNGFALTPSIIQTPQGSIRLLAYPDLKVTPHYLGATGETLAHVEEYIKATEFQEPKLANIREAFAEMMKVFDDDDGSIRVDSRTAGANLDPTRVRFIEWVVRPGEQICATGRYSAERGGLVPDPNAQMESVIITSGEPSVIGRLAGGVGSLIGGLIFLGIVAAGLIALFTLVPLAASEQMSPGLNPTWPEIRAEHFIERRIRPLARAKGMLDSGTTSVTLSAGTAKGRLRDGARDVTLAIAEATRDDNRTTVNIDGNAILLTIDEKGRPLSLRIAGRDIPSPELEKSLDLEYVENGAEEVAGRFTFLSTDAALPACRATFRARIEAPAP